MHLSQVSASLLQMIARDGGQSELKELTPHQSADLFKKLGVVQQLMNARGNKGVMTESLARMNSVSPQAIHTWVKTYKTKGWRGLIDQRRNAARSRSSLPQITRNWITDLLLRTQRNDGCKEVHRQVLDQWRLWKRTGDPKWAIPGYTLPPPDCGKGYPAGMSYENIRRCQPQEYQAKLARQGRIAAARLLPQILGTRVGCSYMQFVFFDDQKHDVQVRVLGYDRPMVPLGFNSIERLTGYSFQPHIRLRWYDADESTHKSLTRREFVWYVITILCTEGYRADDIGTTFVQEHGTAKVWSNKALKTPHGYHSFQDAISALLDGHVKFDDSGLFNKADFKELIYGPKSAGNPRFKAPVESFFHVWRTYSSLLIGQTGRNPDEAPEETYGIDLYEKKMLEIAKGLPQHMQEGLLSNYCTAQEFGTLAFLINDALNARTEHSLEGWEQCHHVEPMWRWMEDPVDMWRSRRELANLPPNLREHALHQQSQNKDLTRLFQWSPARARTAYQHDPALKRMDPSDAILLVPTEWAKPITIRGRQIRTTDELLPGEELIYLTEVTTPRGRTELLHPGDQILLLINPLMTDRAFVYDQEHRYIGTVCRNLRNGFMDQEQLQEMFRQRANIEAALDAPVRRAKDPIAQRRAHVQETNSAIIQEAGDVIKPLPKKPRSPKAPEPTSFSGFDSPEIPDTDDDNSFRDFKSPEGL